MSPNGWKDCYVGDIAAPIKNALVGGPFGSNLVSNDYVQSGVPVIRGQNMSFGRWVGGEFAFVSEDKAKELSANIARPGDLIFTQRGTLGQIALVPPMPFDRYVISQSQMKLTVDPTKADATFLYYFFSSKDQQDYIRRNAIQTGVPHTNLGHLRTTPVRLPPPIEQKAIAEVLAAMDDKIELNWRMNETLEAMAQSLFKSWFVDAAANGLPKGWRESTIGKEVRVVGGSTPSTINAEFWDNGTNHWVTPKDLSPLSSPVLLESERKITEAGVQQISSGLLPVGSVLLSSRAPIGYIAIAEVAVAVNQGFIAMICDGALPNHYVRLWTVRNMEVIKGRSNGTTFMEISKANFRPLQVLVPPQPMLDAFQKQAELLHRRVVSNLRECLALADLRDTLLPKLLSGELRMPQANQPQVQQAEFNIVPLPIQPPAKPARKTTDEFVEAIVIAQFTRGVSDATHPLGRKRYNKLAYLAHRKAEHDVSQHYLKKAAGPYCPWAKYQGPEKIACENRYVKTAKVGDLTGFVVGEKIADIDRYIPKYPICAAVDWVVARFKFRKNDDLELLATVDYATLDLINRKEQVSFEGVKQVIATNGEWAAKLKREIFSDANIKRALTELHSIFPRAYAT